MIHLEHAVIVCDIVPEKRFEIGDVSHVYNCYNIVIMHEVVT